MRLTCGFALTVSLVASGAFIAEANTPRSGSPEVGTSTVETETPGTGTTEAETPDTGTADDGTSRTEAPEIKTPATPLEAIQFAVQMRLAEKFAATSAQKKDEKGALVEFHGTPDRKPLWVDEDGLTPRGTKVIAEIGKAGDEGLVAVDYALPGMTGFDPDASDAIDRQAEAEIKISHAVLDYANDARGGRLDPNRVSKNLDPTLLLPKPLEVIESIAFRSDPAAYLRGFQPQHPQFKRLRQKLKALRGGAETGRGETPKVQMPNGPLLRLGVFDRQVALLRTRLDVAQGGTPELFDETVAAAVKRFQVEHNAAAGCVVRPGTRRLLNTPYLRNAGSQADINKILLNMERWRWLRRIWAVSTSPSTSPNSPCA